MPHKVEKIIIHHSLTKDTDTASWGAIRRYHTKVRGWRDIGYHYGIELVAGEYEIFVGRFEHENGAHTIGMNDKSIGICMVGNFDLMDVPPAQWEKGVKLVRELLGRYKNLTPDDVMGHRDYASYKSCPGKRFDLDAFRNDVS